ncbi:MAG: hypothetical protein ACLFNZ_04860, partial [Spirochaetaceae bacterium]
MKYSAVLILLVFFLSIVQIRAQNPDHYQLGSPEVCTLDNLFLELGESPPFYSRPFSNYQFLYYLEQIEKKKGELSASSRADLSNLLKHHRKKEKDDPFFLPIMDLGVGLKYQSQDIPEFQEYLFYRNSLHYPALVNLGFIAGTPYAAVHL